MIGAILVPDPDVARVLVEFRVESPEPEQLHDLVRALNDLRVRGVEFSGVFTLIPAPSEARP